MQTSASSIYFSLPYTQRAESKVVFVFFFNLWVTKQFCKHPTQTEVVYRLPVVASTPGNKHKQASKHAEDRLHVIIKFVGAVPPVATRGQQWPGAPLLQLRLLLLDFMTLLTRTTQRMKAAYFRHSSHSDFPPLQLQLLGRCCTWSHQSPRASGRLVLSSSWYGRGFSTFPSTAVNPRLCMSA